MKIVEMKEKRAELLKRAREIVERAQEEERALTAEEREQYDKIMQEVDDLTETIRRMEKAAAYDAVLDQHGRVVSEGRIGMSQQEVRQYSLLRAIRAAASGDWRGAELEREASQAVAEQLGREPRGFFVPLDFLAAEQRDMIKGTASQGGYLVATELLTQSFIEMLRNRMVVQAAGATVLSGLVGDIAIPKQTGGATAYWVAESGAPTESQQTLAQVAMDPKTVGAYTDISRKLLLQASLDVEAFVRRDLATVLALAIDYAALHGSGTGNEPTGIENTSGIGLVSIGANGGPPTWSHIVQLETEVAQDNADVGALAYITNAKVRGKLKETEKASGTGIFVWGDGPTPLNGYRALVSNQVRSDLTKGTGTNLSAIFFGNWNDLIIGQWGTLDILVDPYTGGTSGTVRVIAFQDVDVAVRHAESFAAILDADTT